MTTTQPPATQTAPVRIADYDKDDYDYRSFWRGRDYEHWAETRALQRFLGGTPRARWLVDLGGGFGRHVPLYRQHADAVVLVDYSWTNLANAEQALMPHGPDGTLYLIRANLYHLPFRDGAFDLGMTTRVIHHLQALDTALSEMGRTLGERWLLDVPIKHHLLARVRGLARGQLLPDADRAPQRVGTAETPFYSFHLDAVRTHLRVSGWSSRIFASVHNFRRWERALPTPAWRVVRPLVNAAELAAQRAGRGWWGPAQFLWLTRQEPVRCAEVESIGEPPEPMARLAPRMQCPACQGALAWSGAAAHCLGCERTYARSGAIWDFVVA